MQAVIPIDKGISRGARVRRLRVTQLLTQEELAEIAGVSVDEVDQFECNIPVRLDARRRLVGALLANKGQCQTAFRLRAGNLKYTLKSGR